MYIIMMRHACHIYGYMMQEEAFQGWLSSSILALKILEIAVRSRFLETIKEGALLLEKSLGLMYAEPISIIYVTRKWLGCFENGQFFTMEKLQGLAVSEFFLAQKQLWFSREKLHLEF